VIDGLVIPYEKELVIVDDCSADGSAEILAGFRFRSPVVLIRHPQNRGKGAALRTGIERATGDVIGIQDADFEYCVEDIPALIEPLFTGRADVVFGSRFKKSGAQVHRTFHYLINRILTLMSNLLSGLYLTDMETCYKFFHRDIIKNIALESARFGFEPEVTAKLARLKVRMLELPINYFPRNYLQGKKITWRDGIAALRHIVHYNCIAKPSQYFKPTLPARYRPSESHWL
jgi:glycosyltransferase involved in cell wall biosynthesis